MGKGPASSGSLSCTLSVPRSPARPGGKRRDVNRRHVEPRKTRPRTNETRASRGPSVLRSPQRFPPPRTRTKATEPPDPAAPREVTHGAAAWPRQAETEELFAVAKGPGRTRRGPDEREGRGSGDEGAAALGGVSPNRCASLNEHALPRSTPKPGQGERPKPGRGRRKQATGTSACGYARIYVTKTR